MNIYQRLNEVRKKVEYIDKDKEVGGRYWAVTHDAVTALVRSHLIEHGVIIVPSIVQSRTVDTGMSTAKGHPIVRHEARYTIAFVNMDEPSERVEVALEAHALDEGDKAPGKAISYATKYAMLKLFSIESGDKEEDRYADAKVSKTGITGPHRSRGGAWGSLEPDMRTYVTDYANEVRRLLVEGNDVDAYKHLNAFVSDDADVKTALFDRFDSKERSRLMKAKKEIEIGLRAA